MHDSCQSLHVLLVVDTDFHNLVAVAGVLEEVVTVIVERSKHAVVLGDGVGVNVLGAVAHK
jgi:hypothetical protein